MGGHAAVGVDRAVLADRPLLRAAGREGADAGKVGLPANLDERRAPAVSQPGGALELRAGGRGVERGDEGILEDRFDPVREPAGHPAALSRGSRLARARHPPAHPGDQEIRLVRLRVEGDRLHPLHIPVELEQGEIRRAVDRALHTPRMQDDLPDLVAPPGERHVVVGERLLLFRDVCRGERPPRPDERAGDAVAEVAGGRIARAERDRVRFGDIVADDDRAPGEDAESKEDDNRRRAAQRGICHGGIIDATWARAAVPGRCSAA